MESRNKLAMCRLCLSENECFINVFELNDGQGYVAAEVIFDLLQFQVSETDGYPHVVCSECLVKLTDFKLFKECCQKSKVIYDNMFVSSLEEYQPEMLEFVTVKTEPISHLDSEENVSKDVGSDSELCDQDPLREDSSYVKLIGSGSSGNAGTAQSTATEVTDSSTVIIKTEEAIIDFRSYEDSEDPLKETEVSCGPILLKYEVLPFGRESHQQEDLIESERSGNQGTVESTNALMQNSPQVSTTMETKRNKYTAKFKLKVVEYATKTNNCAAARRFGTTEINVRNWRKLYTQLMKGPMDRCANRGRTCSWPQLEDEVRKFVTETRQHGHSVSRRQIRIFALKEAQRTKIDDFIASAGWCRNFMKRHDLVL